MQEYLQMLLLLSISASLIYWILSTFPPILRNFKDGRWTKKPNKYESSYTRRKARIILGIYLIVGVAIVILTLLLSTLKILSLI